MAIDYKAIVAKIIKTEGGYVNNPNDSGGETKYGITIAVARANGYMGPMADMPESVAEQIYMDRYIFRPGFNKIQMFSEPVCYELIDTGVNMHPSVAGTFFQRFLNVCNHNGKDYPDLFVDGIIGNQSVSAFAQYLKNRGAEGERICIIALNSLQAVRYIDIAERRPKDEDFIYGWLKNRVMYP